MRSFNATIAANLAAGRVSVRGLITFTFGSGTYRFVRDVVPRVWGGNTYIPGGAFSVSDIPNQTGFSASSFTVSLAASPDDGLTPAILLSVFSEDYRDRPVSIYDCYINVDTGAVIDAELIRLGYIDRLVYREGSQGAMLEAQCYTRALDYGRTNGKEATYANHQRRAPGDKFREHTANAKTAEIYWGREKPKNG